jgi:hypothetical protein
MKGIPNGQRVRQDRQGDTTKGDFVFSFYYGAEAAAGLGVAHISPNEVTLKPSLVGIRQPMLFETVTIFLE